MISLMMTVVGKLLLGFTLTLLPAAPLPEGSCCVCMMAIHPDTGLPVWACNCNAMEGGTQCTINSEGCFTRGQCPENA